MQTQDQLPWLMLCSGHSQPRTGSVGWSGWWLWRRDSHTSLSNSSCALHLLRVPDGGGGCIHNDMDTCDVTYCFAWRDALKSADCLTARCPLGSGSKPENQNLASVVEPEESWRRSREQHRLLQSVIDTASQGKHTFSVTLNIFLVQPFTKSPPWHTLGCDSGKWNWLCSCWNVGVSPLWSRTEPVWPVCVGHTQFTVHLITTVCRTDENVSVWTSSAWTVCSVLEQDDERVTVRSQCTDTRSFLIGCTGKHRRQNFKWSLHSYLCDLSQNKTWRIVKKNKS